MAAESVSETSSPAADSERPLNPYVGPRPFTRDDVNLGRDLFGRDWEASELLDLFIGKRIVLLHSPSGAGKTSLVQVKLIPALEREGFEVLPVIRVGLEPPAGGDARANRYLQSVAQSIAEIHSPPANGTPGGAAKLVPAPTASRSQVLIFDQFEEIFSLDPTDRPKKAEFFAQLGTWLRDRGRWVLCMMREDYLGELEPYEELIPTRFSTRFRLNLLDKRAALLAVREPAAKKNVTIAESAARALVDDLSKVRVTGPSGETEERSGEHVEPVQLQVVCVRLWERLEPVSGARIDDLSSVGNVNQTLSMYYGERVAAIATRSKTSERSIRAWFDQQLITPYGVRGQVLHERGQSQGLDNDLIQALLDVYLVRAERRRGMTWYELSHDRLIEPVRANNRDWFEHNLEHWQQQAALWNSQSRSDGLLLHDAQLAKAQAWVAERPQQELLPHEREFLEDSRRAQDEIEAEARRAQTEIEKDRRGRRRLRAVAGAALAASCIAVVAFVLAFLSLRQVDEARGAAVQDARAAQTAQAVAVTAQSVAVAAQTATVAQSQISTAFRASAEAVSLLDDRLDLGLLLGLQANGIAQQPNDATRRTFLADIAGRNPRLATYLWRGAQHAPSVAFSRDGRLLAAGNSAGQIAIWEVDARQLLYPPLRAHADRVESLAFSPDGSRLVSGGDDKKALVWDVASGRQIGPGFQHAQNVLTVAFSPRGGAIASGAADGSAVVWNSADGKVLTRVDLGSVNLVFSVAFNSNGTLLAIGSGPDNPRVTLWDVAASRASGSPLRQQPNSIRSVAFSPDDKLLASGSEDGTVVVWSVGQRVALQPTLKGHTNWVNSVAFSPDGRTLATGSNDRTINLWDVTTTPYRQLSSPLIGHTDNVRSVAFSPRVNRAVLASAGEDGNVFLWNLDAIQTLANKSGPVSGVAFSPDGHTIAAASGQLTLWDASTRLAVLDLAKGHTGEVSAVAFNPTNGRLLASGGADQKVILWDSSTGKPLMDPLAMHTAEVRQLAFNPDGSRLASVSRDGQFILTDVASRKPIGSPHTINADGVWSLAWSPDGARLAFGLENAAIVLWDVARAAPDGAPLRGQTEAEWALAFSPDGNTLASGSNDNTVFLWDLTTRPPQTRMLGSHKDDVRALAFSPDGRLLASAGLDKTVLLWDVRTGDRIAPPMTDHTAWVWSLAFSPDGHTLASGSQDETIKLWQINSSVFESFAMGRDRACRTANRNLSLVEWMTYIGGPYQRTCAEFGPGEGVGVESPAARFP